MMNGKKYINLAAPFYSPNHFLFPKTHKQHTALVFSPLKVADPEPPPGNTQLHTHSHTLKSCTVVLGENTRHSEYRDKMVKN